MKRIFLAIAIVAMSCTSCTNSSFGVVNWSSFRPGKKIAKVRHYGENYSNSWSHDYTWIWNGDKLMQIGFETYIDCKFLYDDQNRISRIDIYDGDHYEGRQEFHYDGSKLVSVGEYTITYSGNKIKTIVDEHSNTYSYTWKGGNVTKIEVENSKWGNTYVYEYKYDSKNNPFYGCFSEGWGFSPEGNFHKDFSKNNYTQEIAYVIDEKGKHKEYNREVTYTYTDDGYPLTIEERYYDEDGDFDKEISQNISITYQ